MNEEYLYTVIQAPHMSEKGTRVSSKYGQYAFRVLPHATKKEIKRVIEMIFNVKVLAVRIVNIKGKEKFNRRTNKKGRRAGIKKAYVSIAEGGHIDLFGERGT